MTTTRTEATLPPFVEGVKQDLLDIAAEVITLAERLEVLEGLLRCRKETQYRCHGVADALRTHAAALTDESAEFATAFLPDSQGASDGPTIKLEKAS